MQCQSFFSSKPRALAKPKFNSWSEKGLASMFAHKTRSLSYDIVILTFCLACFTKGWSNPPLLLSLRAAEDFAMQNNKQMNASLHALEQGYYGYRASQDAFLPKVTFAVQGSVGKSDSEHQYSVDSALQITQRLYDPKATYYLKEAQIEWERLRLAVQEEICEILFQVRQAYHEVLLNQARLAVDQIIIHLWEEELNKEKRHLELGVAISYQVNQVQLELKKGWMDYYETEKRILHSQLTLLTLLGLPPNTPFHLSEQEISLPPNDWQRCSVEQWKAWAFQYRPQLQREELAFLLRQTKGSQIKAECFPTLNLYGIAGHRYVNEGFDRQPSVAVGVNLDWTLYDPSHGQRIKQAKESLREAASNYAQKELEAEAIVYELLNEIKHSYLFYLAAQEAAGIAEEGMRMVSRKHELGIFSLFESREAIKNLHEAKQKVNQAVFDLRHAYDRLIQQTGLDLQKDLKH